MKLERILVGIDGSPDSLAAVEWAAGLARISGADVVAVHAVGLLAHAGDEQRRSTFDPAWAAPLARAGVLYRSIVRDGSPLSVLLLTAEEEGADLLVVGSRGVGDHPEQLLGSTSAQLTQLAGRPVVVIPPPVDADWGLERLALRDGREVVVRPVRSDDRLEGELAGFLRLRGPGRCALVALDEAGLPVAIARFAGDSGTDAADVAIAVLPAWRGVGLGTRLLVVLGTHALEHGIHRFTASYPGEQAEVARLVTASGLPHRTSSARGWQELEIDLLPDQPAT